MNREPIYAALFDKLQSAASFTTASRRLKHWADVPFSEQPALFMAQRGEVASTVPGLNTVWDAQVDVYVYVNTGIGAGLSPGELLNPLIDAIETALSPEVVSNKQTLGGLVQHAVIEGRIETDEGTLGDQGVAIIPIRIKFA